MVNHSAARHASNRLGPISTPLLTRGGGGESTAIFVVLRTVPQHLAKRSRSILRQASCQPDLNEGFALVWMCTVYKAAPLSPGGIYVLRGSPGIPLDDNRVTGIPRSNFSDNVGIKHRSE